MMTFTVRGLRMRDERGLYYHAQAGNPRVRVYVRRDPGGSIQFRLYDVELPEVWERHGWIGHETIARAASLYRSERNADADPLKLYDLAIARSLLADGLD